MATPRTVAEPASLFLIVCRVCGGTTSASPVRSTSCWPDDGVSCHPASGRAAASSEAEPERLTSSSPRSSRIRCSPGAVRSCSVAPGGNVSRASETLVSVTQGATWMGGSARGRSIAGPSGQYSAILPSTMREELVPRGPLRRQFEEDAVHRRAQTDDRHPRRRPFPLLHDGRHAQLGRGCDPAQVRESPHQELAAAGWYTRVMVDQIGGHHTLKRGRAAPGEHCISRGIEPTDEVAGLFWTDQGLGCDEQGAQAEQGDEGHAREHARQHLENTGVRRHAMPRLIVMPQSWSSGHQVPGPEVTGVPTWRHAGPSCPVSGTEVPGAQSASVSASTAPSARTTEKSAEKRRRVAWSAQVSPRRAATATTSRRLVAPSLPRML